MKLFQLFLLFCKVNLLSFGGPNVGIMIIEEELVNKKQLLSQEELEKMFVTTNVVPGPVFIQLSVLVGYKLASFWGVIVCLLTSITIIPGLSIFLYFYVSKIVPEQKYNDFIVLMSPVTIAILVSFALKTLKKCHVKIKLVVIIGALIGTIILMQVLHQSLFMCMFIMVPIMFFVNSSIIKQKEEK